MTVRDWRWFLLDFKQDGWARFLSWNQPAVFMCLHWDLITSLGDLGCLVFLSLSLSERICLLFIKWINDAGRVLLCSLKTCCLHRLFAKTEDGGEKKKRKQQREHTSPGNKFNLNKLIINPNHMKSSRLHPDGSQSRTAGLVVSTPHWALALVKGRGEKKCFFFLVWHVQRYRSPPPPPSPSLPILSFFLSDARGRHVRPHDTESRGVNREGGTRSEVRRAFNRTQSWEVDQKKKKRVGDSLWFIGVRQVTIQCRFAEVQNVLFFISR